jgi:hypothetical protein
MVLDFCRNIGRRVLSNRGHLSTDPAPSALWASRQNTGAVFISDISNSSVCHFVVQRIHVDFFLSGESRNLGARVAISCVFSHHISDLDATGAIRRDVGSLRRPGRGPMFRRMASATRNCSTRCERGLAA